jgi:hypothetical protein
LPECDFSAQPEIISWIQNAGTPILRLTATAEAESALSRS